MYACNEIIKDDLIFYIDAGNSRSWVGGVLRDISDDFFGRTYTTINSPLYDTGGLGNIYLNGTQYIKLANDGQDISMDQQNFTIDMWVYPNSGGSTYSLWSYDLTTWSAPFYAQHLRINSDGTISFTWDQTIILTSTETVDYDTWNNLVITRDQTSGNVILYKNSLDTETVGSQTGTITYYNAPAYIGNHPVDPANTNLNGNIGAVKFYRRALTPNEVLINYTSLQWRYNSAGSPTPPAIPKQFVSTWDTTNTSVGSSNSDQVRLYFNDSSLQNDLIVDWGDGQTSSVVSSTSSLHTYSSPGTYSITITTNHTSGTFSRGLYFNDGFDKLKITDISDWGSNPISDLFMFSGCSNLNISATNSPNITTNSLNSCFKDCSSLNANLGGWDISGVDYIGFMFQNCTSFDNNGSDDIGNWDTSSVTNMQSTFQNTPFNRNINSWDVGSVSVFSSMFASNTTFNKPLNNWNTSSATNFASMFVVASSFNQDIGSWTTSNVTSMSNMFDRASSFNQDIGSWDLSSVQTLQAMFKEATDFNNGGSDSIKDWSFPVANNFVEMFRQATSFNQPVYNWSFGGSNISLSSMFRQASSFNQDIGSWSGFGNVTNMSNMFLVTNFNNGGSSNINNLDVSGVTNMAQTFYLSNFNQDISSWTVSNVSNFSGTFRSCPFNNGGSSGINNWDVTSASTMNQMFFGNSSFNQPLGNWNMSSGPIITQMFRSATSFDQDVSSWTVSNISSFQRVFQNAQSFNQDLGDWDVSGANDLSNLFNTALSFNNGGTNSINNWNTSSVLNMSGLFFNTSFNQPIGNWNVSAVTNMGSMLRDTPFNRDLNGWTVSLVEDMSFMFSGSTAFNGNITSWDTGSVQTMEGMFVNSIFNQDIGGWDTSLVTDMSQMFNGCSSFNQNIGSWTVSNVVEMNAMFNNADSFNQDIGGWDVSSLESATLFITPGGSDFTTANYDNLLNGWATLTLQTGTTLQVSKNYTIAGSASRFDIIDTYGWTITDLGIV